MEASAKEAYKEKAKLLPRKVRKNRPPKKNSLGIPIDVVDAELRQLAAEKKYMEDFIQDIVNNGFSAENGRYFFLWRHI